MIVKDLVDRSCLAVAESASLKELIAAFKKSVRTTLPVVNTEKKLVGIISLHDLIKYFMPYYVDLLPTLEFLGKATVLEKHLLEQIVEPETNRLFLVHDIMNADFVAIFETDSTFKALALMIQKKYHHLPVVNKTLIYIGMIDQRQIILSLLSTTD